MLDTEVSDAFTKRSCDTTIQTIGRCCDERCGAARRGTGDKRHGRLGGDLGDVFGGIASRTVEPLQDADGDGDDDGSD